MSHGAALSVMLQEICHVHQSESVVQCTHRLGEGGYGDGPAHLPILPGIMRGDGPAKDNALAVCVRARCAGPRELSLAALDFSAGAGADLFFRVLLAGVSDSGADGAAGDLPGEGVSRSGDELRGTHAFLVCADAAVAGERGTRAERAVLGGDGGGGAGGAE